MRPIRIAIIGYGKIAEDQHVPSIAGNPRFELVATSSRSGQGVAKTFTDWRELIRSVDGLEAVAITTPPGPRYEIARECLLAGLHCLLEKPPTAGLAEIADLDCLAQAQGVTLFTRTMTVEAYKDQPMPDGFFRIVNPANIDSYHAAVARELALAG